MSIYKICLIFVIAVLLAGGAYRYILIQRESFQDCRDVVDYYQTKYRYQTGSIKGFGHFNIVSLDGGNNWYAFAEKNNEVKILGTAEDKFPGLLKHLKGMEDVASQAVK